MYQIQVSGIINAKQIFQCLKTTREETLEF